MKLPIPSIPASVTDDVAQPVAENLPPASGRLTEAATSAVSDYFGSDEEAAFAEAEAQMQDAPAVENFSAGEKSNRRETNPPAAAPARASGSELSPARQIAPRAQVNTDVAWREAEAVAAICREFETLLTGGQHSLRTAAQEVGRPASFFSGENSPYQKWKRGGLAALLPKERENLAARVMEVPGWFIPAARFFYLLANRTINSGSVPEAVRRTISLPNLPFGWTRGHRDRFLETIGMAELPVCPADLREQILARQAAGQTLVTERIAKQIIVSQSVVKHFRSPREWSLANQSAPGSQRRFFNKETCQREIMQPGDWFGGDDATPGIAVCVPCKEVVTPVSQKFGVLLGRFQWLAYHDARTDKLLAWDYVVRPRGSYRAEDILNGMGAVVRTHGVPRKGFQFEGGAWNSKLVRQAIELLNCEHWRTYSPHQKAIEAIFNKVWTRLAVQFPHADMGRFRNENEANCKLYEACKAGHQDPRRYFPTLDIVVKVFEEEVAEHNSRLIKSSHYGQWVPDDLFADSVKVSPLRGFSHEMEWIFSPFSAERMVKGMMVSCRVPMFEKFSVPFDFGADWMPEFSGCKVRLHFNPRQPKCRAKVILLENHGAHQAGEILGDAVLISETASHIRYILGWGDDDQRAGYLQRQRVGNFVRRETRGIGAGGRVEYAKSEERDGLDKIYAVEAKKADVAKNHANGISTSGSDDPASVRPALRKDPEAAPVIHNKRAVSLESSQADQDAGAVLSDRAARRAALEALTRETDKLFT
jgi:hypothetical protein